MSEYGDGLDAEILAKINQQLRPLPWDHVMTLRDWFAGMAILKSPNELYDYDAVAKAAYELADAMLAERAKK